MQGTLLQQLLMVTSAMFLLTTFAILAQRHMRTLIHWFAAQGMLLAMSSLIVGITSDTPELLVSAMLALLLKGLFLPWLLWRIILKLGVHHEVEPLVNIPMTMLIGTMLVLFSFYVSLPVERISHLVTRNTLAIATACVLLSMLTMLTRKKAITQVVGFMSMENALFFTATAATYGMPLVVELGIAFDILIAALIFGLFFMHINKTFDSLDLSRLHEAELPKDESS